jgi:hypothetical protein
MRIGHVVVVVVEDNLGECAKKTLFTEDFFFLLDDNKG